MKFIISIIICTFLNSAFGQIRILKLEFDASSIKIGDPIFHYSNEFSEEPDLRKREELVIHKYEKEYDDLLIAKQNEINNHSVALDQARANDRDTIKLYNDLNIKIADKHNIEIRRQSIISEIKTDFSERITLEESTTAIYSEKNFKGNRVTLTGDSMDTYVPFYVKSVRVAKGCRVKLYPWKNLRKEPGYDATEVKKNSREGIDVNIWITSRIGAPTIIGEVTRARSWRLFCN